MHPLLLSPGNFPLIPPCTGIQQLLKKSLPTTLRE